MSRTLMSVALLLCWLGTGLCQAPPPGRLKGERLRAAEPDKRQRSDFRRLISGQDYPLSAERREQASKAVSRWMIYRLTWDEIIEGRDPETSISSLMDDIFEALREIRLPSDLTLRAEREKRLRQQKFQKELVATIRPLVRDVIAKGALAPRMNAVRILHHIAKLGYPEVWEDLVKVVEDPTEHDAVRYWAIEGIGEVFAHHAQNGPPAEGEKPAHGVDVDRCARAVYRWLEQRTQYPAAAVELMTEEERHGVSFLRRSAIRALGHLRRPLIVDAKNGHDGPVAELLLKIMTNTPDSISPEPSWRERVDAARAICKLRRRFSPSYQPATMAYYLGRFIADLNAQANFDRSRTTERWKYFASVLERGTAELAEDLKGNPQALAYFQEMMQYVNPSLTNLFDADREPQAAQDLNRWLNDPQNRPKNPSVFAGAKADSSR